MYVHTAHPSMKTKMLMKFFAPPDVLRSTGDQQLGWMAMYVSIALPLPLFVCFFGDAFLPR
jgi:hypothetical protein